jgi:hypothetical protein
MQLKKNIKVGKVSKNLFLIPLLLSLITLNFSKADDLEGNFTHIKVLDKISSKNTLIKLENKKETKHKDLIIKSIKCKNSEFDDNPEITAYLQVRDLINKNNDDVFIFNGWMFSSSPSIAPFDHPVYDIWLVGCY